MRHGALIIIFTESLNRFDMKIVFLDAATMGNVSFEPFERLGDFVRYENSTPEEARERVKDIDVLLINKVLVNKELIDAAPNLKLICIAATGVNNIDVEYAASKESRTWMNLPCASLGSGRDSRGSLKELPNTMLA